MRGICEHECHRVQGGFLEDTFPCFTILGALSGALLGIMVHYKINPKMPSPGFGIAVIATIGGIVGNSIDTLSSDDMED